MVQRQQLIETLRRVGKPFKVARFADGTRLLIIPDGGRILGLFAPDDDANFFWTHPALQSMTGVRRFYAADGWRNYGGDRTWLAPEAELFIADLNRAAEAYQVPPTIDPGAYILKPSPDQTGPLRWRTRGTIGMRPSRKTVRVEITKTVLPAPSPLRGQASCSPALAYAGYTLQTSLQILSRSRPGGIQLGIWNLLQMPHGGQMLIPTFGRTTPTLIFGKVSNADLQVRAATVRYWMRATGNHKISLRASAITGRVGYLYRTNAVVWNLIIRNFSVNPSGEYVDAPWNAPSDRGYCFQACNVNSDIGRFAELEYHVPAVGLGTGGFYCQDQSQVWAFRGGRTAVREVGQKLLGWDIKGVNKP